MNIELNNLTENDMTFFAGKLALAINGGAFIHLEGPLGVGKTTLVRGFLRKLGINDKIKSPTYTLVEPYDIDQKSFFHFDLYRLKEPREIQDLGLEEYFTKETVCLIEWPEKGGSFLPPADLICQLEFEKNGRRINLMAKTLRGEEILKRCHV